MSAAQLRQLSRANGAAHFAEAVKTMREWTGNVFFDLPVGVARAAALTLPVSASEAHSLANVRKTRGQMVDEVRAVVALRDERANPPQRAKILVLLALFVAAAAFWLVTLASTPAANDLAFPGAEGFSALATGGRTGEIVRIKTVAELEAALNRRARN